jgi:hypothetical protein
MSPLPAARLRWLHLVPSPTTRAMPPERLRQYWGNSMRTLLVAALVLRCGGLVAFRKVDDWLLRPGRAGAVDRLRPRAHSMR